MSYSNLQNDVLTPWRELFDNSGVTSAKETLIKATLPGFFVREAATPKFASS